MHQDIFIRLLNDAEKKSEKHRRKNMWKFPVREGYGVCYKPYGAEGAGYYYTWDYPEKGEQS